MHLLLCKHTYANTHTHTPALHVRFNGCQSGGHPRRHASAHTNAHTHTLTSSTHARPENFHQVEDPLAVLGNDDEASSDGDCDPGATLHTYSDLGALHADLTRIVSLVTPHSHADHTRVPALGLHGRVPASAHAEDGRRVGEGG
eukprot:361679-Chlamydomonas_euryale.AAC.5